MIAIPIQSETYGEKLFFIDGEDFNKVKDYKWHVSRDKNNFYVKSNIKINGKYKTVKLHRIITSCPDGLAVDHIDGNTLNNTRSNLRICTPAQNTMNCKKYKSGVTSKYKGVYFEVSKNRYRATINRNGEQIFLGTFKTELEAVTAYNKAALIEYGEFARLNIIN